MENKKNVKKQLPVVVTNKINKRKYSKRNNKPIILIKKEVKKLNWIQRAIKFIFGK